MKKIIITSSMLALFASATMAELTYPIQVDNFTVIKEDINGEIIAQDNLTLQVSSTGSFGESLVYVQSNNANITKFTANGITTSATFAENYKWLSLTGILNLESVKESYTLDNASFTNNSASTTNTTTGTYGSVLRTGKVSGTIQNSIFKGNYGYSNNQVQGTYSVGVAEKTLLNNVIFDSNTIESTNSQGGAIASFGSKEISINNSSFISNTASSQSQYAYGGAVYLRGAAWGGYADGVANISNTTFDKNTASSYSASQGGAIYIKSDITGIDAQNGKISTTLTDSIFTNNASVVEDKNSQYVYVSGGGAVYSYDSIVNFVATKDITNVGNYASIAGVKQDDRGGFLYLKSNALTATANFNISENATMTIGNGTVGYDSIASENGTATINKTGAGSLVVNSSMEYFTGTLNVNAGTMEANNGLGAGKTTVKKGATLNVDGFVAEGKTVLKTDNGNIEGGFINTKGTTTWDNATVKNNTVSISISNDNDKGIIGGGIARIDGGGEMTVNNAVVSDNNTSVSAKVDSAVHGSLFYAFSDAKLNINNSVFENNTASSTYNTQGGVVSANGKVSLNVNDSIFKNNLALQNGTASTVNPGFDSAQGGVANIFAVTGDVVFTNVTFEGNKAKSTDTTAMGGAAYIYNSNVTFNDVSISNNSANGKVSYSGAIHMTGASEVTFNVVDKDGLFVGNYAGDSDENGGLMKLNKSTVKVNFNIADKKTLTVGNGTAGYDSIAGADGSTINKTGAGALVVNSSMEYFTGTLNVNAGTMDANNGLGAKAVNIASGATLNVGLTSTSLTSATVVNDGILGLKRGTLADGDTLTISSYSGEGTVNAFGGSFANGVFTAGKSTEFTNNVITVGSAENDVQTVSFVGADNNKLVLDFNVSGKETMTVNNITEVSEAENIVGDFITGFSVDATYNGDLSVVLSAYVGDISNPANLVAWHKADGSNIWTKLDGEIEYDASTGFASIFVEGFSSYAFSQVPEPSTYALILGVLALSLAMYRRRR